MESNTWIRTYVIQILPVLAFFIYIIGFAYYIVYYCYFGINIISYITLTEVLISTLVPVLFVVIISAISFVLSFISRTAIKQKNKILCKLRAWSKKHIHKNKYLKYIIQIRKRIELADGNIEKNDPLFNHCKNILGILCTFLIICIIMPLCIYIDVLNVEYKYIFITLLLSLGFLFLQIYIREYKKIRFMIVRNYCNMIAVILIFISTIFCSIRLGIYNAQCDKLISKQQFSISTTIGTKYTSDNYSYIGECGNAIFLFKKDENNTIILNRANIVSAIYRTEIPSFIDNVIEEIERFEKTINKES